MNRQPRLLAILQLFEQDRAYLTVEEIAAALGIPVSTTYRHVRSLVQIGFLDPVANAAYALGPGFIRYDRLLRQTDRLIGVAVPVMQELLSNSVELATVVLSRRFRDCVMCVHEVANDRERLGTSYERGVAMPIFLGATSKIILANLPDHVLKKVFVENKLEVERALGLHEWSDFKKQFRDIRRLGHAVTDSEVTVGRVGIAAPIFRDSHALAGVSLVMNPSAAERERIPELISKVVAAGQKITERLANETPLIPR